MRNKYKNMPNQALVDRLRAGKKEDVDTKEAKRRSRDNLKKFAATPKIKEKQDPKLLIEQRSKMKN